MCNGERVWGSGYVRWDDQFCLGVGDEGEKVEKKRDVVKEALTHQNAMRQLHRKLWHPPKAKMQSLLRPVAKRYGIEWKEVQQRIEKVYDECDACKRVQRPYHLNRGPGFIVRAQTVNEWAAVDSVEFWCPESGHKIKFVCMVDLATRWTLAEVVRGKGADGGTAVRLLSRWQTYFGSLPKNLVSDNGREFANQELADYLGVFEVVKTWTCPYRPSSNGSIERHGGIVKTMIGKVRESVKWALAPRQEVDWRSGGGRYGVYGEKP